MEPSQEPRWGTVIDAADEWGEPPTTVRRWALQGRIPARRIGRKWQVDRNALGQSAEPETRYLTERDKRLAREVAAALLPLTDSQREKLSLVLSAARGRHGAA